jgi:hypothetical protein
MKTSFPGGPFLSLILGVTTSVAADHVILPALTRPYDQCAWLATHNSYSNPDEGFDSIGANQPDSIIHQLNYGVRVINPDIWLVRQKMVGFRNLGTCKWEFEEYPDSSADTTVRNQFLEDAELEVVVAHGGGDSLFGPYRQYCEPWKAFTNLLIEIRGWVQHHTNEVISLVLENKIHPDNQGPVEKAFRDSGLDDYVFYLDRANPGVPAPAGRAGGWAVNQYGFPTLQHLVNHRKTVVRTPLRGDQWKYDVSTVYGHESLNPAHWTEYRSESSPLNDFTRRSFALVHAPDLPNGQDYHHINSISMFRNKWEDIRNDWNRLPNTVWVDYYDRGFNLGQGGLPGPAQFVNDLNELWNSLPEITPLEEITPAPSAYGWNNSDVRVTLSGSNDVIQAITSRTFGAESISDGGLPINTNSYILTRQGVTTVSFSAVGNLGNRSPLKLVNVSIDKTSPTITGTLDRPPDRNGWYASDVTAHFQCDDTPSGIASCPPDKVLSTDGANQSVTGVAIDRADNQSSATITGINIDKTGPLIRATTKSDVLWPPNGKLVSVVISGVITDAGSGVDPANTSFTVSDEYQRLQPGGRVVLGRGGAFSFTVRLEARRLGNDFDGRRYTVRLNATDRVGHSSQTSLTVTVPRDQRPQLPSSPKLKFSVPSPSRSSALWH